MTIDALTCPSCGAPVSPGSRTLVSCEFCGSTLSGVPQAAWGSGPLPPDAAAARWDDRGHPRFGVAGKRYVLLGLLAKGDGSDVFLARRDQPLTELVVVKVLRALGDRDLLDREQRALAALEKSDAKGGDYFASLLPQRVGHGPIGTADGVLRHASVFRWRTGF